MNDVRVSAIVFVFEFRHKCRRLYELTLLRTSPLTAQKPDQRGKRT